MHKTNFCYCVFFTWFCQGFTLFGQTLPKDKELKPELVLPIGHTGPVSNASYSPDGKNIVTASVDGTTKIWDAQSGKLLYTLERHSDRVVNASYSLDGKSILTASWDKTTKIWNAKNGRLIQTLKGHTDEILNASYSPGW